MYVSANVDFAISINHAFCYRFLFLFFLSFLAPELCVNIYNVRRANASLSHGLYGLVCQHESGIHTEYRMQKAERTSLVISTCRQLFVPSLSFRSSTGSRRST